MGVWGTLAAVTLEAFVQNGRCTILFSSHLMYKCAIKPVQYVALSRLRCCYSAPAENSDGADLYKCAQCQIAVLPSAETTSLPKNMLDDCFAIASI